MDTFLANVGAIKPQNLRGLATSQMGFDGNNSYFLVNALEKKISSYEITVLIFKVFKTFKPIQVTKASFFLYFSDQR